MQIFDSILDTIGQTPLVRLSRLHPPGNLVAKVEYFNPGGSVKERIAVAMIDAAEREGKLRPGGTIIEPTSGNTGVGLALVGAVRGYRVICTIPTRSPRQARPLRAYGVEVIVTRRSCCPRIPTRTTAWPESWPPRSRERSFPTSTPTPTTPAHYSTTGPEVGPRPTAP